ncbi:2-oxoacid:ferredoxin oxidoreductase, alpha subunit [Cryptobacterium curtum DSM 15641]|uniref:2-oxoacid:ferredoxin oxidoreductase, alpha subunit n=1 Tax=Cryptobacterium curtum (strain ATCC 700683 / DSM 15641 / CCUG 43107 / 12-3) TaxID=469378 RepID=C7MNK4_CRYCD|nr:3-methyl-2-oxobutanoate dehydrogenase subunit VorB [Cryptobacterium curtum]ACU94494.1 2-oxoacid:ferredoxin oxidoreductase, alpha subunit [Cryptobacterium curtum DSM 15641]
MGDKVLMKGNEALAAAALRAGCRFYFGYPITPQTEIAAYMSKVMPRIGGAFLQAESEISAINMLYGAAAAGARAMTSSSSPGISLKGEGISYMAGADLPGVIVNVERGGPGLGSIQPSQQDYWQATRAMGHGDSRHIVYAPSTVQEMADLTYLAFDKADEYRMPVIILADGLLGQMMEAVKLPEEKGELPEKPWATSGHGGARPHNIANSLYLKPDKLEKSLLARYERYERIEQSEQRFEGFMLEDAEYVVVAFGASARIARSAVLKAREEGISAGLLRPITLWPYPNDALQEMLDHVKAFLSVEMSMGQMIDDIRLAIHDERPVSFYGRTGGMIPTPEGVLAAIERAAERTV